VKLRQRPRRGGSRGGNRLGHQAEIRQAEALLPEAVATRGDGPAVLCHGEPFPAHIFVAMGEDDAVTVTGLIDFGDACGGRPLLRMLIGYTAHDIRTGKPAAAQGYLAGLKAVLASLAA
jgi:Ser/Thr protein kinase RdoA (MazF antagonist)